MRHDNGTCERTAGAAVARPCAHCGRANVTIHARGLCSLCYRDHRQAYPRTKIHRPYTARERELIRRDWGRKRPKVIAAELGRNVRDVYHAAMRFGASRPRRIFKTDPAVRRKMVRLHEHGLSDREISGLVGFSHASVARWLRQAGLPSNCRQRPTDPFPAATVDKIRRAMLDRIERDGLESAVAFLRKHSEGRAQATRMGWPQAGTLFEAKILDRLCDIGPQTADALTAAGLGARRAHTGLTVRDMVRRGLLVRAGKQGWHMLYGLPPGVGRQLPKATPKCEWRAA